MRLKVSQTQKNLLTNILVLLVNILVGLYYTPFLVNHLGLIAYGIVPLTLIINQYINVLAGSLTGALSRFYTISVQKKDYVEASSILSTILVVILFLVFLLIPLIYFFISDLDKIFTIPLELLSFSKLLFVFTISSFFLSLFSSILNIILYAQNRLDLMNVIKFVRTSLKLFLVVIFFELIDISLIYVGVANCVTEILVLVLSIYFFVKYVPGKIIVRLGLFNKAILSGVLGMAVWTMIHQVGDVFLYRVDNLIVNRVFGTLYSGALGAVSEFGTYISLIIGVIASLYGPVILIEYSKNNHEEVKTLALNNSLVVGVLTSILVGGIIAYSEQILKYWLGGDFICYSDWFIIKLLSLPFIAASGVFAFVNRAWNSVKYPALFTVFLGFVNICILYFMASGHSSTPLELVSKMLLFSMFVIVIQTYGINTLFFNKNYPGNIVVIMRNFIKIFIVVIVSFCVAKSILFIYKPSSLIEVFCSLTIMGIVSLLFTYFCLLNAVQRSSLLSIIIKPK